MCFVFIWEQTATCASQTDWFFITEMASVYSAVWTGSLNKAVCASSLKYHPEDPQMLCVTLQTKSAGICAHLFYVYIKCHVRIIYATRRLRESDSILKLKWSGMSRCVVGWHFPTLRRTVVPPSSGKNRQTSLGLTCTRRHSVRTQKIWESSASQSSEPQTSHDTTRCMQSRIFGVTILNGNPWYLHFMYPVRGMHNFQ